MKKLLLLPALLLLALAGCKPDHDTEPVNDEDLNLGGGTSISGSFIKIFEQPAANLSDAELELHRAADRAFGDIFVTAPNHINGGLGPVFNQNACESCHVSNGRSPFPEQPDDLRGLLFRISVPGVDAHGGPLPAPGFGGQLQTRAVFGKQPEGRLSWELVTQIEQYLDGESATLNRPVFSIGSDYLPVPGNLLASPRMAPPVIGLGLLEAVRESDVLALADPADANGDGISGKANRVWDVQLQAMALGRFGWKAGQPTLLQQSAGAYNQDMGITNPLFPQESCQGQAQCDTLGDDPEIDLPTLRAAAFYAQSLAVPQRRNVTDPVVVQGKKLFFEIGCDACHHQKFVTGQHPEYGFLSNQTIFPYTDLLLHDMGEGLADNRPDYEADGREWRTPPLWGVGLVKTVGGPNANYLHDGRAHTLEEAVLWHGGEGGQSRQKFRELDKQERTALLKFLESL